MNEDSVLESLLGSIKETAKNYFENKATEYFVVLELKRIKGKYQARLDELNNEIGSGD